MRKNFGAKPYLYPQPVLIVAAYGDDGVPNAMNAAWGGMIESNKVAMCLGPRHKTVKNILETGAFTIGVGTTSTVISCDYVGIISGNDEPNKLEKAGFTVTKSEFVDAPIINELPMCLECKLISYNEENSQLIGEIINVNADETILTDEVIDANKLQAIIYDPVSHYYLKVGEPVGHAFDDGKKLK